MDLDQLDRITLLLNRSYSACRAIGDLLREANHDPKQAADVLQMAAENIAAAKAELLTSQGGL